MQDVESSIEFDEALRRLREGYDDTYEGWLHGMNDTIEAARENGWDKIDFVGNPRVQHAIWRYQHFDADEVRNQVVTTLERGDYRIDPDEAIELLCAVAEEM